MADVVKLNHPDHRIWVCACGCSTFCLRADGAIFCANCDADHSDGAGWREKLGNDDAPDEIEDWADIQGNGSVDFAKARVKRIASNGDAKLLVVADASGALSCWGDINTNEQLDWCLRKLSDAADLLRKKPIDG